MSDSVPHDPGLVAHAGFELAGAREAFFQVVQNEGTASRARPVVPDYELLRVIGRGAYGEVWLGRNILGDHRAVKVVWRQNFAGEVRPFEREFEGIRRFEPISRSHPTQLAILHVGKNEELGYFYYVMELADDASAECRVRSAELNEVAPSASRQPSPLNPDSYVPKTLRRVLRERGALPAQECLEISLALAGALAHLHAQGLVHRDIKPSNVVFVGGVPKLADIGLVAAVDDTLSFVGTAGYIPPEGPGSPSADVFSLGKVLYEALTGRDRQEFPALPQEFASPAHGSGSNAGEEGLVRTPERTLIGELNQVILRACESDCRLRYPSAQGMLDELTLLKTGGSVKRKRIGEKRRVFLGRALLGALLVAALCTGAIFLLPARHDRQFHSRVPGVDALVERGSEVLKRTTPEGLANALDYFNQAARKDPGFAPALIGVFQARMLRCYGANPSANEDYNYRVAATNLVKVAPGLAEARIASCGLHYMDGNLSAALADVRKAAEMPTASQGGFALVHSVYGWCLMNTFDPEGGLRELLLAESARRSDPIIEWQLGNAYAQLHDFPKALEHYDTSIRLEPAQTSVYELRANVYREQGKILESIQDLETFWRMAGWSEPKDSNNVFNELRIAFQQGPDAYWRKRLADQTQVSPPEDPHEVATCLAHLGKLDEAYDCLRQIKEPGRLRERLWFDVTFDRSDPRFKALITRCGSALLPAAELTRHR